MLKEGMYAPSLKGSSNQSLGNFTCSGYMVTGDVEKINLNELAERGGTRISVRCVAHFVVPDIKFSVTRGDLCVQASVRF